MIGTKLANRYEIVEELGRGGMGVVYRAHDPLLNRDVAVKLVPPSNLTPSSEERFRREAQLVAQMDHPSIVPIFDIGQHEGSLFFLMPVVRGSSLRSFLKSGSHTLGEILDIVIQVADALEYSHVRGVIHRDIKPENIMASVEDGALRVRVMDFGLAKGNVGTSLTKTGTLVGTVSYFSPEQVSKATIDARSDLYSLGVVLYEAMTGKPPFVGEIQTVLYRIAHEFPRSPRAVGAKIDEQLDELVLKMLAKDPAKRFQSGAEVAEALSAYRSKLLDEEMGDSMLLSTTLTAQIDRPEAPPFVGREKELAEIQKRLNLAVEGECQFVVVAGEPGIGKTRLLEEVENLAHARKIRVLHGRFVEQDRTFSYQGFCEVIQEYFRGRDMSTSSSGERPDFSDLASDLGALFPVLMEISDIRSASGSDVSLAGAEHKRIEDRTFVYELLARTLVRIAGGKPLVLVFENLHGAEMSIEALQYVVRRMGPTPTLIAATYRQTETDKAHPLVRMLDGFGGDARFAHIVLGSLSREEHKELLSTLVGSSRLSGAVTEKLFEATEANPFFTKELVRALVDSGGIAPDETGEWSMSGEAGISADALPVTIQQAVEKRIERLSEDLLTVLSTAAILGKTFDFNDLEVLVSDDVDLDDAIDTLIADGILEEERESRGDRLTFASGIVRDVLYNGISRRKRKSLHRKYAAQLEKKHSGRLDRVLPQLVHHFSEGDEPEKTVTYGLELARKTLAAFSPEETVQVARTVLDFLEDDEWGPDAGLEGEVRLILASATRQQGNLDAALREVESAIRIFEKVKDPGGVVRALLAASEISWQSRRVEQTRNWLDRGIQVCRETGDLQILPQFLSLAATMAGFRGEHDRARDYLDEIETIVGKAKSKTHDAPSPGGVLTVALANPIGAREPAVVEIDEEVEILSLVFETLVVTDEHGHVTPCLCEDWEVREDGHVLVLHLRGDVRFHDGSILSASDVKKSFERSVRVESREMSAAAAAIRGAREFRSGEASDLAGVVVTSDREVEIRIDEPLPIYPALLTDPKTAIVKVVDDNVIGTGPFRMTSHSPREVLLERNEEHWGSTRPPLDGIEFKVQKGSSEIATGLRSGSLDVVRDLLPQDLEEILRQPAFRSGLVETPKKNSYFVMFNTRDGAAKHEALRRALSGVVRANDIVWRALGRQAQPAAGVIPPGVLGHDAGRRRPQLSRDEADAILVEAGIDRPLHLRAAVHPLFRDRYRALAAAIFDAWSALDVEVEIATPDMEAYLKAFKATEGIDMVIGRWNADYDDPDNFTHGLFRSGTGVYSRYVGNEETDEILTAARSATDPSEREALYRRFENMVLDNGAIVPLFHEIDYRVASPKVIGIELRNTPPYVNYAELGRTEESTVRQKSGSSGGILYVPVTEDIPNLDPVLVDTYDRQEVVSAIFQTLTTATQGARIVPHLASDFRLEDGGRKFRFFLRNDVQFHNGRRLTARDVRYSWERLLLSDSVNRTFLSPIRGAQDMMDGKSRALAGFRIVSGREFVVELDTPQAFFPTIVSHPATAILPEGTETVQGTWRDSFAGTGPFRVVRFEPSRTVELERNPDYWRAGYPNTDGLVFHLGMAPEKTLIEFKAGRLSIAGDLHLKDIDSLRHDPVFGSGYRESPRLSIYFVAFNLRTGLTKDRELRAKLMNAVDVEGIVRRTLGRLAIPANSIVPPGLLGYSDDIRRGRSTLKATQPLDIELEAVVHPVFFTHFGATLAELQESMNRIGVRIKVLNKTWAEYLSMESAGAGHLLVGRWIADFPDADTFIYGMLHTQGAFLTKYCSIPEIDALAERARAEVDPAVRHTLYVQAQEVAEREALLLPLFHDQTCRFARPEVEGLRLNMAVPEVLYEELAIQ